MKAILPLAAFFAFTTTAFAQKTPDEALKTFTVAEGLQLELFASEPMFVNPTCIDVDHKGRVWVCESVNYRCDLRKAPRNRKEGDRIVILEDTDGDGKADKSHTFYQEKDFIAPLGICIAPLPPTPTLPHKGGRENAVPSPSTGEGKGGGVRVYVCHSPHIYVFEDADGDLKADGPPKILLTGFMGYDHDHGVHGIHFGPDGKLYFSVGDQGVQNLSSSNGDIKQDKETRGQGDKGKGEPGASATGAPATQKVWTTNRTDCQAATVWRCNADGTNLELLAHNFRNPYEPAVDSFGTVFISDNDDDGNQQTRICHVMFGGNYGYWPRGKGESHWHEEQPGIVHKTLRTGFGSPTGLCWYEGTLLPLASRGRQPPVGGGSQPPPGANAPGSPVYGYLLHTDAGPREVRCFIVKPKGAGYECDKLNLVTSTDNWFRPSDVCVAPDGSVFVSDWYDPGVGGHGMGDTTRGRIYRLTAKGQKGYKVPAVKLDTNEAMLEVLASPCLATRTMSTQQIQRQGHDKLEDFLVFAHRRKPLLQMARASYAVWPAMPKHADKLGGKDHLSAFLLLLAAIEFSKEDLDRLTPTLLRIDHDILNRRFGRDEQTKGTLDWLEKEIIPAKRSEIAREFLLFLRDSEPHLVPAAFYSLAKHYDGQDHFYLAAINIAVGTDPKRREIILADFEKHFPEWNDKTAKLVWELRPPQVIAKLDQKLTDPKLTAEQKAFVLEILANTEGDAGGKTLLRLLAAKETPETQVDAAVKSLIRNLPTRWAGLRKSAELKSAVDRLLSRPQTEALAIDLIVAAERVEETLVLVKLAMGDRGVETRQAAMLALGKLKSPEGIAALQQMLGSRWDLRSQAVQALGIAATPEALQSLQRVVKNDNQPEAFRNEAVAALAGSRAGSQWLLEAKAKNELPDIVLPEASRLLRNSPHQDLRNRALIAFPAPGKLDPKKLPAIATLVKRRGDAEHGREVFRTNKDVACMRCHSVRGVGGNIGPDLSMIGKKGSRDNLFESIITPDKAIADQFVQWVVLEKRGVSLSGLLIEETPDYIVIRDGFGKDNKLWTKDIEEKAKSKKSVMPDDAVAQMTEQELIDVVAYLETLKTPALTPESWHILGPFDNGQNDAGLDKAFIPEPKVDLRASHDGRDDKVSWRTIRLGADGYYNLQAFHRFAARDTVSYLYREIESPADQEATILVGTDDGCKLWVNGTLLLEHRRHEAATPERDTVKVKLKKGTNSVLLKINNGDGPHGFYFTVVSEQELKLAVSK